MTKWGIVQVDTLEIIKYARVYVDDKVKRVCQGLFRARSDGKFPPPDKLYMEMSKEELDIRIYAKVEELIQLFLAKVARERQ